MDTTRQMTSSPSSSPADFYLAGASKSGTTSLFQVMRAHPQLFFPINKEPHYYSWGQDPPVPATHFSTPPPASLKKYHLLFSRAKPNQIRGDASTSYLSHPKTAERIACARPDARFIFILRNPVERAYSAYQHFRRDGHEPAPSLEEALQNRSCPLAEQRRQYYLEHGLYGSQIQRYLQHFPASQIKVFLYEELTENTHDVVREIYNFLDVDESLAPDTLPQLNRSGSPRILWLRDLVGRRTCLHDILRTILPHDGRTFIRECLEKLNTTPPPRPPGAHQLQLQQFYRDDLKKLSKLTGKQLDHWIQPVA